MAANGWEKEKEKAAKISHKAAQKGNCFFDNTAADIPWS